MDRYEYIYDSIPKYINGYTTKMMPMNIDRISMIANTLGKNYFMAFPIGYFLTIELTEKGEIGLELEYSVLTRNSRTIQSYSNVVLM
jgi:hypothetical protein